MLTKKNSHKLEDLLIIRNSDNFKNILLNRQQGSKNLKRNVYFCKNQYEVLKPVNLSFQKNSTGFYLKKDTYTEFKFPNLSKKSNIEIKKTRLREIEKEFLIDTFKNRKIKSNLSINKSIQYENDPYREYRKLIKERNLILINDCDNKYEAYMKL